jgi:hypothetical protein
MKKTITWPTEEFTMQELIGLNPNFDTLTLQFLVNRGLSDGTVVKTKQSDKFRVKNR